MQIPILNGIYVDSNAEFRTSYPRNYIPVPKKQGISNGYMKPADGIVLFAVGPGVDRGGINWNGICYRVMGSKLVSVNADGTVTTLGDVGNDGKPVSLDYSFDRLAISSNKNLFYYMNGVLTQVLDADLGQVNTLIWVDGYFMTTDGVNLVVTDLNDPTSVNPLKYGSAEADPDQIVGLLKVADEPYAVGRYTIEVFQNVGGNLFPFQRILGAMIQRGAIGTYAMCVLQLNNFIGVAFLGSARNEPPSVWYGVNGTSTKLSTREIDTILQGYTEAQLSTVVVEPRIDKNQTLIYVHLPDQTLVYDADGSQAVGEPVWFTLTSGADTSNTTYRARRLVWVYNQWISGDPTSNNVGYYTSKVSSHYGTAVGWIFGTMIIYNQAKSAIFHELELIGLPGHVALGKNPTIWTSYSVDGEMWTQERPRTAGVQGRRQTRVNWLQMGAFTNNYRIQRFRGNSDAHFPIAALEARIEPLGV